MPTQETPLSIIKQGDLVFALSSISGNSSELRIVHARKSFKIKNSLQIRRDHFFSKEERVRLSLNVLWPPASCGSGMSATKPVL